MQTDEVYIPPFFQNIEKETKAKESEKMHQAIVEVLKLRSSERTTEDLTKIVPFFQQLKFFKEKTLPPRFFIDVLQRFQLEEFSKRQTVFEAGDIGTKFYIILKGSFKVLLKTDPGQKI